MELSKTRKELGRRMTDKQREILKKYLSEENIIKVDKAGKAEVYSIIEMITHFRTYGSLGEYCSLPYCVREETQEERQLIEDITKSMSKEQKKEIGLMDDEYAYIDKVCYIPGCGKWYVVVQKWFKGESSVPNTHVSRLRPDGKSKMGSIYDLLVENEIYSITGLLKHYTEICEKVVDVYNE